MNSLFLTEADSGLYFVFRLKSGAKKTKFSKGVPPPKTLGGGLQRPPTPQLKIFIHCTHDWTRLLVTHSRSTYFILPLEHSCHTLQSGLDLENLEIVKHNPADTD